MEVTTECSETSPTTGKLSEALAKAQASMRTAKKDSLNPHFKSKYADLTATWEACREALSANGLSVAQTTKITGAQGVVIVTRLMHVSGEWLRGELFIPVTKYDAQGIGSAMSYGRRYGLSAMVGVAADDDDGETAVERAPTQPSNVQVQFGLQQATTLYTAVLESDIPDDAKQQIVSLFANKPITLDILRGVYSSVTASNLPEETKTVIVSLCTSKRKDLMKTASRAVSR